MIQRNVVFHHNWIEAKSNELTLNPRDCATELTCRSRPSRSQATTARSPFRQSEDSCSIYLRQQATPADFGNEMGRSGYAQANSAVSSYLRETMTRPGPSPCRGVDPVVNFLASGHAAHCGTATATVMLLRSLGVPARYITGYVVDDTTQMTSSGLRVIWTPMRGLKPMTNRIRPGLLLNRPRVANTRPSATTARRSKTKGCSMFSTQEAMITATPCWAEPWVGCYRFASQTR